MGVGVKISKDDQPDLISVTKQPNGKFGYSLRFSKYKEVLRSRGFKTAPAAWRAANKAARTYIAQQKFKK